MIENSDSIVTQFANYIISSAICQSRIATSQSSSDS